MRPDAGGAIYDHSLVLAIVKKVERPVAIQDLHFAAIGDARRGSLQCGQNEAAPVTPQFISPSDPAAQWTGAPEGTSMNASD